MPTYNPGAVNRFGFNTTEFNLDAPNGDGVFLSPDGTATQLLNPSAACSVSLPNPALCNEQIRRIINISDTNAITVRQYNAALNHSGDAVVLTGAPLFATASTLSAASSGITLTAVGPATGSFTNRYYDVTYYCNGSTWVAVAGNITGQVI